MFQRATKNLMSYIVRSSIYFSGYMEHMRLKMMVSPVEISKRFPDHPRSGICFFFEQEKGPEGPSTALSQSGVTVHLTDRTLRKQKITHMSLKLAKRTPTWK